MIKTLVVILIACGVSFYNTDLKSDSALFSILLPMILVISLISLALWLVTLFHRRGIKQTTSREGGGMDFHDSSSGGGDGA